MLTPAEAAGQIAASLTRLPAERRRLLQAAGRVLAEPIQAEADQPPFDRIAMDGIAISYAAFAGGARSFHVQGTQGAGAPPQLLEAQDACVEVMTGASLPAGADTVVPSEQYMLAAGRAELRPGLRVEARANVHARGTDLRAGTAVLAPGVRLGTPELAILAGAGRSAVEVARQPRIMVVSTGDELIEPGLPLAPWQVRRSNVYGVLGCLRTSGYEAVSDDHLVDEEALMRERLAQHLATHDVLILSGGVSAGRYDHVPRVLAHLGVNQVLHRVAQRPGMPLWFGTTATGRAVFGLPGNPVSTLVCLRRYVVPALLALQGSAPEEPVGLPLGAPVAAAAHNMTRFLPVDLRGGDDGFAQAVPHATQGSGDFSALAGTAGFVELAPGSSWERGRPAPFYHW
jgi:molybdopterin molybdotransferase